LVANSDLSALKISVNTTGGVVTLSGSAPSTEAISKAMLLAMETDGVREVVSTLQVQSR
jgi:osmotically-inducible protein OsmY